MSFDKIKTPLQVTGTVGFFEVDGPDFPVMSGAMMLGEVVGPIFITRGPVNFELALFHSVLEPIKSHVNGFAVLLFYSSIDYAIGGGVISFDWCWRLRMAQFFEVNSHWDSNLCIHK